MLTHNLKDKYQGVVVSKDAIAILYCDGFHDDTKAVQLIIDGGKVV